MRTAAGGFPACALRALSCREAGGVQLQGTAAHCAKRLSHLERAGAEQSQSELALGAQHKARYAPVTRIRWWTGLLRTGGLKILSATVTSTLPLRPRECHLALSVLLSSASSPLCGRPRRDSTGSILQSGTRTR